MVACECARHGRRARGRRSERATWSRAVASPRRSIRALCCLVFVSISRRRAPRPAPPATAYRWMRRRNRGSGTNKKRAFGYSNLFYARRFFIYLKKWRCVLGVLIKTPSGGMRLFRGVFEPGNPFTARSTRELDCELSEIAWTRKGRESAKKKHTHRAMRPPIGTTNALQREWGRWRSCAVSSRAVRT